MTAIYSSNKIVPIADHDPAKFPKRLFAQNEDGSLTEVQSKVFYRVEQDIQIRVSIAGGGFVTRSSFVDNRPLFVEVE